MYILGIDPGPVVGVCWLHLGPVLGHGTILDHGALQVTPQLLSRVLHSFDQGAPAVAIERFVVSYRSARSNDARAGEQAREVLGVVADWAHRLELPYVSRSASEVKPWATDQRLAAAGLLDLTASMRHARDGARHALYCAVRDYGLPDPLSRRAVKG